jgi:hypothetical protein
MSEVYPETPLDYAGRCERYARRRGWAYAPNRISIGRLTPRQRRRAMAKENRAINRELQREYWESACAGLGPPVPASALPGVTYLYDDDYGQDPHDLGYCVTPGCNCCGGDD